ncbi:MAG: sugar phosphate nucleotidyltransferase [Flavobacteriales bacterium]|jgi:glucose-1-phosphate thymidylyltransferase|nr:sugar phosphate nucleotidyltransferase [Flavobacteriales bacterium]MDP7430496.1 sugar phosphate nucleotidyltransferase [Flavobacteriales bacterium]HJN64331.1 sugar phosphate nucleotidyltransferase [Flavobacteriales bacterium]|tara:strand:- start:4231 stop:5232 length:1002 start_codon:yes stop_codon:yes gene_type:complete
MKIIVPMAGRGSRLRPHTLTIPKPLILVAGKPIVQWLVEDIVKVCGKKVDEIAFVIGDFGKEVEESLVKVAEGLGAKGSIYYQDEPLGTAHAILCAKDSLEGNCVVAFADTLFKADFTLDGSRDGIIWVSQIDDPSAFGVVKLNEENIITDFVEKSETFISDLAIIGIYYFNNGEYLRSELQYLLDNNIKDKGEFQLTNALENMKNKGTKFSSGKVEEWLDCGNKDATIYTNERVLEYNGNLINDSVQIINSEVIPPCFIGANTIIKNAKIGPHVSLGGNTVVENSVINKTIIQNDSMITNAKLSNSMIGNHVNFDGKNTQQEVSIGDFSEVK